MDDFQADSLLTTSLILQLALILFAVFLHAVVKFYIEQKKAKQKVVKEAKKKSEGGAMGSVKKGDIVTHEKATITESRLLEAASEGLGKTHVLNIDDDDDDWEGVEISELEKVFAKAVNYVEYGGRRKHDQMANLGNDVQMHLYGLRRVALDGPCHEPQLMALKISARAKWNAWQRMGSMSPDVAMEQYIKFLSDTYPDWMQNSSIVQGKQDLVARLFLTKGMQIWVNDFYFEVESSYTVKTLKKIVKEIGKIPVRHQILEFNNQRLKNSETLSYYSIENQSILKLFRTKGQTILIFVHTMDEKILNLDISDTHAVVELKEEIYKNNGTPVEIQTLMFNKKNLEDNLATLSYYHVIQYSELYLVQDLVARPFIIKRMQIRVNDSYCEVKSSSTVKTLKKILKEIQNIPVRYQVLEFNNQKLINNETLSYYSIENQSILKLFKTNGQTIRIFVHTMDRKILKLDISDTQVVVKLKEEIYNNIGTPIEIQKLMFHKENLKEDYATLSYYHIIDDSELYLV